MRHSEPPAEQPTPPREAHRQRRRRVVRYAVAIVVGAVAYAAAACILAVAGLPPLNVHGASRGWTGWQLLNSIVSASIGGATAAVIARRHHRVVALAAIAATPLVAWVGLMLIMVVLGAALAMPVHAMLLLACGYFGGIIVEALRGQDDAQHSEPPEPRE